MQFHASNSELLSYSFLFSASYVLFWGDTSPNMSIVRQCRDGPIAQCVLIHWLCYNCILWSWLFICAVNLPWLLVNMWKSAFSRCVCKDVHTLDSLRLTPVESAYLYLFVAGTWTSVNWENMEFFAFCLLVRCLLFLLFFLFFFNYFFLSFFLSFFDNLWFLTS